MALGVTTKLKRYDAGSSEADNMELVGGVMSLDKITQTAEALDDTPYGDDGDDAGWNQYTYGIKDGGELSVTVRYDPANDQAESMVAAFDANAKERLQVIFPAPISKKCTFTAVITEVGIPLDKNAKIDRAFKLKVSGRPVWSVVA